MAELFNTHSVAGGWNPHAIFLRIKTKQAMPTNNYMERDLKPRAERDVTKLEGLRVKWME